MSNTPKKKSATPKKTKAGRNLNPGGTKARGGGGLGDNGDLMVDGSDTPTAPLVKPKGTKKRKNTEAIPVAFAAGNDWVPFAGKKHQDVDSHNNNNGYKNGKASPGLGDFAEDGTAKDDDDEDDDDGDDKIDSRNYDPERLKAFNMFVRLFVDENLDRIIPISKQPKEKIQAIIDSCTRQFPEFAERARKRIRTYLKSCRRNKRTRGDANGWESTRPTPAHLTSVQAEQILAQACENESQNAKRMRMGLEPVGQPLPSMSSSSSCDAIGRTSNHNHNGSSDGETTTREGGGRHVTSRDRNAGTKSDGDGSKDKGIVRPIPVSSSAAVAAAAAAAVGHHSHSLATTPAVPATSSATFGHTIISPAPNPDALSISSSQSPVGSSHSSSQNGGGGRPSPSSSSCENHYPSIPPPLSSSKLHERIPLLDYSRTLNGNGLPSSSLYRSSFPHPFPGRPSMFPILPPTGSPTAGLAAATAFTPSSITSSSPVPGAISGTDGGPTDLSMKSKQLLTQKLSPSEVSTVRQLITGYRESAAFLLRSADELEQLLIQQQ